MPEHFETTIAPEGLRIVAAYHDRSRPSEQGRRSVRLAQGAKHRELNAPVRRFAVALWVLAGLCLVLGALVWSQLLTAVP